MEITTSQFFMGLVLIPVLAAEITFDYFQLVQEWPRTFCHSNPLCLRNPLPKNFTLHGLWPGKFNPVVSPQYCDKNTYDKFQNKSFFNRLDNIWTNLKQRDIVAAFKNQDFWRHEWEKHGTCSLNLYSQDEYFALALELKDKLNILEILEQSGITPDPESSYPAGRFTTAIKKFTASNAAMDCKPTTTPNGKVYQLLALRVCFKPAGRKYINCPKGQRFKTCRSGATFVNFPPP